METDRTRGKWFVLHVLSGQEKRVKNRIDSKIRQADANIRVYESLIPEERETVVKNGKKTTITTKLFPGYVCVRMDLYKLDGRVDEVVWEFIREIQGVISFIGGRENPNPLSQAEVEKILRQDDLIKAESTQPHAKVPAFVSIGGSVRIIDGVFANFEGVVNEIDEEHGKLKLAVSMFGRSTPVDLEFWQVGPVGE
mgnify:CR=1 FL=1